MAQVARLYHGTGVKYCRLVDGYLMYTDVDLNYHSHFLTTFNPTLNKPINE